MIGQRRTYLDWNATAPLRPEAREAMVGALDILGNPSSVHREGRAAKGVVEEARRDVAALVGAKPEEVVFTSGATEAAGILARWAPLAAVHVPATAHDAVWAHRRDGSVDGAILAMGLANSETGILTEPEKTESGWRFEDLSAPHLCLDVTQAVGRVPWSFSWSGADLALLSGHKLGGPKGVGALLVRAGLDLSPLQSGGGQELGRRSGTENIPGIAGFGAAARAAAHDLEAGVWARVEKLRNILEITLADGAETTIFVGKDARRLPNTSLFVTPGWKGETQVMQMDLQGFAVSSGSACSSGKVKSSRVLGAMGLDARAAGSALRVSMGPDTTEDEVLAFAEAWRAQEQKFRQRAA
ncbi:MAG: aminotransferase class V-fold PLP-dependent enzyme [Pseudomonadota bacterium]